MAKLYFYYSAMNAGKSTTLLQSRYNYHERGMQTCIFAPKYDMRFGNEVRVTSRLGCSAAAIGYAKEDSIYAIVTQLHAQQPISCVLIDEGQFLTRVQVWQCTEICDVLHIPVLCYGLRSDFQGNAFAGSHALLTWADELIELKTVCSCGKKASMVLRIDADGNAIREGLQVDIGGNDKYISVCRQHFKQPLAISNL